MAICQEIGKKGLGLTLATAADRADVTSVEVKRLSILLLE